MEEAPLPEPVPSPSGAGVWINRVIALSALITSVVSIFLGIQNGDSMNRLVEANSWPHLSVKTGNFNAGERRIDVKVVNQGVGPASVHRFVVLYRGKAVSNAYELFEACCLGDDDMTAAEFEAAARELLTFTPSGRVVRPGEEVPVFGLRRSEENAELWDKVNVVRLRDLTYDACFCSVFDECWESDLTSLEKTPVRSCAPSQDAWRG